MIIKTFLWFHILTYKRQLQNVFKTYYVIMSDTLTPPPGGWVPCGGALHLDIPEIPSCSIRNVSVTSAGLRTRDFLQYSFPPIIHLRKTPTQIRTTPGYPGYHPSFKLSFLQDEMKGFTPFYEGLHNRSKRVNLIIMFIMYSIVI